MGGREGAPRAAPPLRRRGSFRVVDWDEVPTLFAATSEAAAEAARLRDMHPSDVAHLVLNLPLPQRRQLAEAMEDDRLADVLEELSEAEQLGLIEGLDLTRLVSVLEEMEYDDAVDLLAEMPGDQRYASARCRWTPRRPTSCGASSPTARAPPAA